MSLDLFNYPRTIIWISVTEGYTDQSTGEWVAESSTDTEIQAHISDIALKERQYLDPGVVEKGVRKLACDSSVGVVVGDRVVITEKDSSKTTWPAFTSENGKPTAKLPPNSRGKYVSF